MTTAQGNGQQNSGDKAAAGWFAAIMTLALGGAGLIIAALAVGAERTWAGGATEQRQAKERRGSWLDNQRAWLDQDNRARATRSKAYGSWLNSGSDPATMPARPSWWRRMADGLHRRVANTAVAGSDFRTGFTEGWQAADRVRRDGGTFADIRQARPVTPTTPVAPEDEAAWRRPVEKPAGDTKDGMTSDIVHDDSFTAEILSTGDKKWAWACRSCTQRGFDLDSQEAAATAAKMHRCGARTDTPEPAVAPPTDATPEAKASGPDQEGDATTTPATICPKCHRPAELWNRPGELGWCQECAENEFATGPIKPDSLRVHPSIGHGLFGDNYTPNPNRNPEGDNMGSYQDGVMADKAANRAEQEQTARANAEYAGVPYTGPKNGGTGQSATESNATVLRAKLQTTQGTLGQLADLTDQLAAMRQQLDQQVRDADEFATATGQSAQARTALDESSALAAAMGERLGEFSQGAVGAQEQMMQASDGLRVAEHAEDSLRTAGADGRAVAPAGANA